MELLHPRNSSLKSRIAVIFCFKKHAKILKTAAVANLFFPSLKSSFAAFGPPDSQT
jgi:hypothetical protein